PAPYCAEPDKHVLVVPKLIYKKCNRTTILGVINHNQTANHWLRNRRLFSLATDARNTIYILITENRVQRLKLVVPCLYSNLMHLFKL
ncbi:MAG TPA: hypothetical protein VFQ73_03920, partial [Flavisolibacter sp.]|nr:hypothetical protein [Flavisolibacter sp.]